jgi:PAS domain S-box-containing protein
MIELIVQESSDGIVVVNNAGRIELCNERAGMLFGTTRTMLTGRPAANHLPPFEDMAEGNDALVQRHADLTVDVASQPTHLEIVARRLSMPLENGARVREARIDVYTLRDVTTRRRAAEAERRAMDDRLNVERAKSNFIANMSHELRTPLNAIIGFSEMIAGESLGPVGTAKYAEFADVVAKSGHHLLMLINNVLEVSRIGESDVEAAPFDFSELVSRCVANLRRLRDYRDHAIVAQTGSATIVRADERLVRHVLFNLLANAVKFSGERGNVAIRAWSESDAFVFEVADDGVGIDPALMPHLTELFYQTDLTLTRKHEGMGVGLYLVKRYLDMMKGSLHIESEPGKGTTMRVTLPGAAPAAAATAAA